MKLRGKGQVARGRTFREQSGKLEWPIVSNKGERPDKTDKRGPLEHHIF